MNIFREVEKKYKDNFNKLGDKRFHFASRLYLWNGDEFAKTELSKLKSEYIGTSEKERSKKIIQILKDDSEDKNSLFEAERKKFFIKYPLLKRYNKILFKNLFCESVYGINLKKVISSYIKDEEFLDLRDDLWEDKEAIAVLSTRAVNYFYALDYYLGKKAPLFDPGYFLEIAQKEPVFGDKKNAALQVYLLTHCIIGESAFYSRGIDRNRDSYGKMFSVLEDMVKENYEHISLDSKVEFLVCAKLCKKNSHLENRILLEAEKLFDFNEKYFTEIGKVRDGDAFRKGEHRNVLALMAFYLEKRQ